MYATTIHLLPLHELLKDLTWIGDPNILDITPLRLALHRKIGDLNILDIPPLRLSVMFLHPGLNFR
jgi:hypothetical protein